MYFILSVGDNSFLLLPFEVKVLQCIRILETSPVMTKLISALFLSSNSAPKRTRKVAPPIVFPVVTTRLRFGLRIVGLGHFLVGESAIVDRAKLDEARRCMDGVAGVHPLWCSWVNVCKHIQGNAEEALDALGDQAWQNVGSWKLKIW